MSSGLSLSETGKCYVIHGNKDEYDKLVRSSLPKGIRWAPNLKSGPGWVISKDHEEEVKNFMESYLRRKSPSRSPKKDDKKHVVYDSSDDEESVSEDQKVDEEEEDEEYDSDRYHRTKKLNNSPPSLDKKDSRTYHRAVSDNEEDDDLPHKKSEFMSDTRSSDETIQSLASKIRELNNRVNQLTLESKKKRK